jgi:hypothetical protein
MSETHHFAAATEASYGFRGGRLIAQTAAGSEALSQFGIAVSERSPGGVSNVQNFDGVAARPIENAERVANDSRGPHFGAQRAERTQDCGECVR